MWYFAIGFIMFIGDAIMHTWRGTFTFMMVFNLLYNNVLLWPLLLLRAFIAKIVEDILDERKQ